MTTQKRQQRSYTALEFYPHSAVQAEVRIWIEERFYYQNHQSQDSSMNFNWHQSRFFR